MSFFWVLMHPERYVIIALSNNPLYALGVFQKSTDGKSGIADFKYNFMYNWCDSSSNSWLFLD